MKTSHEQLSLICNKAYKYYLNLFGKYIDNPRKIKLILNSDLDFPSDPNEVPACTKSSGDIYEINFNIPLLLTRFQNYINLICWHEVAHVVCDELYRCNDKISQNPDVNLGHPVLFFKVINSWKDMSPNDAKLQHTRHELPYNYGKSEGFERGYNPIDELVPMNKRFSYRVSKIFGR